MLYGLGLTLLAAALDVPSCKDGKGRNVVFISDPSESGMANARAEYRRDCNAAGQCRQTPIVVYNPKHPYFIDPVMTRFSLRHECGHHAHGDTLRKPNQDEPLATFVAREAKADCYAATRGKREGVLSCKNLRAVAATLADAGLHQRGEARGEARPVREAARVPVGTQASTRRLP